VRAAARKLALWTVAVAAVAATCAHAETPATQAALSAAERQAIEAAVEAVRQAILAEDTAALMRLIDKKEALVCTDTPYSREQVRKFLADKRSHLSLSLYDTREYAKRCGERYPATYPALSEREFLRTADRTPSIKRLDAHWVRVTISSPVKTHYPREWHFHRDGRQWKLAGPGFIIGSCTCG